MLRKEEVRGGEERSDELTATMAGDENRASLDFCRRRATLPVAAIPLTHHPNPFRDSLLSSQIEPLIPESKPFTKMRTGGEMILKWWTRTT